MSKKSSASHQGKSKLVACLIASLHRQNHTFTHADYGARSQEAINHTQAYMPYRAAGTHSGMHSGWSPAIPPSFSGLTRGRLTHSFRHHPRGVGGSSRVKLLILLFFIIVFHLIRCGFYGASLASDVVCASWKRTGHTKRRCKCAQGAKKWLGRAARGRNSAAVGRLRQRGTSASHLSNLRLLSFTAQ